MVTIINRLWNDRGHAFNKKSWCWAAVSMLKSGDLLTHPSTLTSALHRLCHSITPNPNPNPNLTSSFAPITTITRKRCACRLGALIKTSDAVSCLGSSISTNYNTQSVVWIMYWYFYILGEGRKPGCTLFDSAFHHILLWIPYTGPRSLFPDTSTFQPLHLTIPCLWCEK